MIHQESVPVTHLQQIKSCQNNLFQLFKTISSESKISSQKMLDFNALTSLQKIAIKTSFENRFDYFQRLNGFKSHISLKNILQAKDINQNSAEEEIILSHSFQHAPTLHDLIEDSELQSLDLIKITKNLIELNVRALGCNDIILTPQNLFYIKEKGCFNLNNLSFNGFKIENCFGKDYCLRNYKQVYPFLDSNFFTRKIYQTQSTDGANIRLNYLIRIRSVVINLLSIILQKTTNLLLKQNYKNDQISEDEAKTQTSLIKNSFEKYLNIPMIIHKIKAAEKQYHVNYQQIFKQILIEERQFSWTQLKNMLLPYSETPQLSPHWKKGYESFLKLIQSDFNKEPQPIKKIYIDLRLNDPQFYFMIKQNLDIAKLLKYPSLGHFIQLNLSNNKTQTQFFLGYLQLEEKSGEKICQKQSDKICQKQGEKQPQPSQSNFNENLENKNHQDHVHRLHRMKIMCYELLKNHLEYKNQNISIISENSKILNSYYNLFEEHDRQKEV